MFQSREEVYRILYMNVILTTLPLANLVYRDYYQVDPNNDRTVMVIKECSEEFFDVQVNEGERLNLRGRVDSYKTCVWQVDQCCYDSLKQCDTKNQDSHQMCLRQHEYKVEVEAPPTNICTLTALCMPPHVCQLLY